MTKFQSSKENVVDKELKTFLSNMNFSENEINSMKEIAPLLNVTKVYEIESLIDTLVQFDYPKSDITELFAQNPRIMTANKDTLIEELTKLKVKKIDVEQYIKQNPFFI